MPEPTPAPEDEPRRTAAPPFEDELRGAAAALLRKRCTAEAVAVLADGPESHDRGLWEELVAMGLPGLAVNAEHGGAGLGLAAFAAVQEELGRRLAPVPTAFLPAVQTALAEAGPVPAAERWLRRLAEGGTAVAVAAGRTVSGWVGVDGLRAEPRTDGVDGWVLHGRVPVVADAPAVQALLVAVRGEDGLRLFLTENFQTEAVDSLDATRPLGAVTFDGAADLLAGPENAAGVLAAAERTALLVLAADAVGVAAEAADLAVAYAGMRRQFGRAIGSFQAVSHRCADMFVAVESARSLVAAAASACDDGDDDRDVAVALAAANAFETAVAATQGCIQVHGGIGFTWEHPAHRYLRRAKAAEALVALPDRLRDRAAASLLNARTRNAKSQKKEARNEESHA